jgi:hypothetical protein
MNKPASHVYTRHAIRAIIVADNWLFKIIKPLTNFDFCAKISGVFTSLQLPLQREIFISKFVNSLS